MGKLLFTGGTVVTAEGSYRADVLVEDEKVAAVGTNPRFRRASHWCRPSPPSPGTSDGSTPNTWATHPANDTASRSLIAGTCTIAPPPLFLDRLKPNLQDRTIEFKQPRLAPVQTRGAARAAGLTMGQVLSTL